jgi:endonuclease I
MLRKISIIFLFVFVKTTLAQIPNGYYNSAQGLQGLPLKQALHNIIDNHNSASYSSLWSHFQATDAKPNGEVWDIYSDVPNGIPPYTFTFISDQCGSYQTEGDCYNREHTWPQSWFNSSQIPSSDLFHVYPTDGKVNGIRSNYPYGNVGLASITTLNGSKLGTSATLDYTGTVFEPIDEYKGDVARNYFYMSTRYFGQDGSWSSASGQMANKSEIEPWGLALLLSWHHLDTVSTKELNRNNAIFQIQNNRNPFIDNPQWADSIWAQVITDYKQHLKYDVQFTVYPNPANDAITININSSSANNYVSIRNIYGASVLNKILVSNNESLSLSSFAKGIYTVQIVNEQGVAKQKLIIR